MRRGRDERARLGDGEITVARSSRDFDRRTQLRRCVERRKASRRSTGSQSAMRRRDRRSGSGSRFVSSWKSVIASSPAARNPPSRNSRRCCRSRIDAPQARPTTRSSRPSAAALRPASGPDRLRDTAVPDRERLAAVSVRARGRQEHHLGEVAVRGDADDCRDVGRRPWDRPRRAAPGSRRPRRRRARPPMSGLGRRTRPARARSRWRASPATAHHRRCREVGDEDEMPCSRERHAQAQHHRVSPSVGCRAVHEDERRPRRRAGRPHDRDGNAGEDLVARVRPVRAACQERRAGKVERCAEDGGGVRLGAKQRAKRAWHDRGAGAEASGTTIHRHR